ncbi:hypothetical protein PG984_011389 [Apiospora sp. TS-2023a]
MDSLPETLLVLGDVLKILNMQVLCVIDGLHWLEDRSTTAVLSDLLKTLRNGNVKGGLPVSNGKLGGERD